MNEHKPKKIAPFLPILSPQASDLMERIIFEDNIFKPKKLDDVAVRNLIQYLGWNKKELADDRSRHIKKIQQIQSWCNTKEEFIAYLKLDKDNLSFITALESALKLPLFDLIKPPKTI